ncbi:MAG: NADH-ubiquinone/plastoquinone oxidoreductase, chain 3 family protein [Francisellaceae bacterium]|nr:NADH-ubiquinone/plastoquinone oxidoreductase, chain 3 family protein [Francisellaceae bacterium]
MLKNYFPILVFLVIGLAFGLIPMLLGKLLGKSKPNSDKLLAYECGFDAFENARLKFDVRFYLIAILFIIFDLEIAFLFPFAVVFRKLSLSALIAMAVFLGLLVIGFIYEWKKGALEWE